MTTLRWRWGFTCLKLADFGSWKPGFFYLYVYIYIYINRNLQWTKNCLKHGTENKLCHPLNHQVSLKQNTCRYDKSFSKYSLIIFSRKFYIMPPVILDASKPFPRCTTLYPVLLWPHLLVKHKLQYTTSSLVLISKQQAQPLLSYYWHGTQLNSATYYREGFLQICPNLHKQ